MMNRVDQTRSPRVVVADSSPLLRSWLAAGLAPLAVEVTVVASGWELLDVLAEASRVDLVVAEERLPGTGGANVLAAIRGAGVVVPFLLVAPLCRPSVRALVRRAGGAALLDDPLDTGELRRLAAELLRGEHPAVSACAARPADDSRRKIHVG